MRIIRFSNLGSSEKRYGILENQDVFELVGNPLKFPVKGKHMGNLSDVKLLSPCLPSKIVCVALNFDGVEGFSKNMLEPLIFVKPPTCCANPDEEIINPFTDLPWWGEAELGVVIKKETKNMGIEFAKDHILGFTIGNDTTVGNLESRDHHLARSKCPDKFCSFGPWIDTDFDASDCLIEAVQNGEVIRRARSSEQFWQWPKIISEISKWMTLKPYDLILTGNPPDTVGMRYLNNGDVYTAKVEGLGELTNNFSIQD